MSEQNATTRESTEAALRTLLDSCVASRDSRHEDWDTLGFQAKAGDEFRRAQIRYIGSGATGDHDGDDRILPAGHFTFSNMRLLTGAVGPSTPTTTPKRRSSSSKGGWRSPSTTPRTAPGPRAVSSATGTWYGSLPGCRAACATSAPPTPCSVWSSARTGPSCPPTRRPPRCTGSPGADPGPATERPHPARSRGPARPLRSHPMNETATTSGPTHDGARPADAGERRAGRAGSSADPPRPVARLRSLRAVSLHTPRATESAEFYSEVWGLTPVERGDGAAWLRGTGQEHHILELHEAERNALGKIVFSVGDRREVDTAARRLAAHGTRPLAGPGVLDQPGGGYGLRFADPEGRLVELSCEVEAVVPGDPEGRAAIPRKLAHVVLNTVDIDAACAFYTQVLGMRISDWSEHRMAFLRCNNDHHAIAFNQAEWTSLNHVAYEMTSIDHFMRGIGRPPPP